MNIINSVWSSVGCMAGFIKRNPLGCLITTIGLAAMVECVDRARCFSTTGNIEWGAKRGPVTKLAEALKTFRGERSDKNALFFFETWRALNEKEGDTATFRTLLPPAFSTKMVNGLLEIDRLPIALVCGKISGQVVLSELKNRYPDMVKIDENTALNYRAACSAKKAESRSEAETLFLQAFEKWWNDGRGCREELSNKIVDQAIEWLSTEQEVDRYKSVSPQPLTQNPWLLGATVSLALTCLALGGMWLTRIYPLPLVGTLR
jgi:hypothetical protein